MANIVIFKLGQTPQYLTSVNTPEYCDIPEDKKVYNKDRTIWGTTLTKSELPQYAKPGVIINPDISAVKDIDKKFWKRSGNNIVEMSLTEKAQVDVAEKQVQIDRINNYEFAGGELAEILVDKGILSKTDVVNLIKQKRGL